MLSHAVCRGDGSNSPAHGKSLCGNFSVQYSIVLYRHGRHANFACSNGRSPDTVQRRDASALPRSVYCLSPFIVWPNPQVRQPSGTRLCPRLGIGPGRHCRLGCTATVYIYVAWRWLVPAASISDVRFRRCASNLTSITRLADAQLPTLCDSLGHACVVLRIY